MKAIKVWIGGQVGGEDICIYSKNCNTQMNEKNTLWDENVSEVSFLLQNRSYFHQIIQNMTIDIHMPYIIKLWCKSSSKLGRVLLSIFKVLMIHQIATTNKHLNSGC